MRRHVGLPLDQVLPRVLADAERLVDQRGRRRVGGHGSLEGVEEDRRADRTQLRDGPVADRVDLRVDRALREREGVAADRVRRDLAAEDRVARAEGAARQEVADVKHLRGALHRPRAAGAARLAHQRDGLVEVGPESGTFGVGEAGGKDQDLLVVRVRHLGGAAVRTVGLDALPGRIEPGVDRPDADRVDRVGLRGGRTGDRCSEKKSKERTLQEILQKNFLVCEIPSDIIY